MNDIEVEPLDESGRPSPEAGGTVTFGRGGRGLVGWLRDQPRLRAIRARRPSYGVVAIASAMVAGTAVAVYMDRPVEEVRADPEDAYVVLPESWLNVQVDDQPAIESTAEVDRMLARHSADATLVTPLRLGDETLVGLPPGSYQVRASCSTEPDPSRDAEPAWFEIQIIDLATRELAVEPSTDRGQGNLACDGEPHLLSGLTVTDYQAFTVYGFTGVDDGSTQVSMALSFTPVR